MAETIAKFQEHKFIVRSLEDSNTHWEVCKSVALFIPRQGNTNWHNLFPLPAHPQDNQNICVGCKTEVWARLSRPHLQTQKEEAKDMKAKAIAAAAEEKAAQVIAKAKEKITNILK